MSEMLKHHPPALTPQNFINRELSTMIFKSGVLRWRKTKPPRPCLERVKFIAIVGNNLDEFYMVRVANYFQKLRLSNPRMSPDGITPHAAAAPNPRESRALIARQRLARRHVFDLLASEGKSIS